METLNAMLNYITFYIQPIIVLLIGIVILVFVGYINWYGTIKANAVRWIGKYIFRNQFRSEQSADGLFMVGTSLMLAIGGILVVLAVLFLDH
jgi:hypothetical protein